MFQRDTLLKEMRQHVIEITVSESNGNHLTGRFTLRPDLLPPNYEKQAEIDFHNNNPKEIIAWNVRGGGWVKIDVDSVRLTQDVSETY